MNLSHPPSPLFLSLSYLPCLPTEEYTSCHLPETKDSWEVCARSQQKQIPKAPNRKCQWSPENSAEPAFAHSRRDYPQQSLYLYTLFLSAQLNVESIVTVTPCSAFTWTVIHYAAHQVVSLTPSIYFHMTVDCITI